MLKKETFVKVIELIKKQEEINENISEALDPICEGNGFFYCGGRFYEEALIKVLKESMNDADDYQDSWIEWWLYEEGRDAWINNIKIPLDTAEQLYDFLVKENERKGEQQ